MLIVRFWLFKRRYTYWFNCVKQLLSFTHVILPWLISTSNHLMYWLVTMCTATSLPTQPTLTSWFDNITYSTHGLWFGTNNVPDICSWNENNVSRLSRFSIPRTIKIWEYWTTQWCLCFWCSGSSVVQEMSTLAWLKLLSNYASNVYPSQYWWGSSWYESSMCQLF